MSQKPEPRKFYKVSFHDDEWLDTQSGSVLKLFRECAKADPYGDEAPINSSLKRTAFFEAKKILEQAGIFKFRQIPGETDGRKIQWLVTYLHGSNNKDYWKGFVTANSISDEEPSSTNLQSATANSNSVMANCKSATANSKLTGGLLCSDLSSSLDFNQTESENLIICEQNPKVSSSDDSLRSTQVGGREEEKSSVLTKDLEVLQHPLSTDQDLGSHSNTNSSSTKTTPNTEPSCSSSQKKRLVSTSDDGSVESIRFRSPRDVNRAISPCDPCQRVERSEHAKTPQSDVRSHDDVRKLTAAPSSLTAPQAPLTPTNAQSHRNPTQSSLKAQLGGSQLESAIEELEESLQAVADDLDMTVEGGIDELCRRFAGLATETEVELLPVPREYPYYDRMNEWVLYEERCIVCFLQRGSETRRLTIGRFR